MDETVAASSSEAHQQESVFNVNDGWSSTLPQSEQEYRHRLIFDQASSCDAADVQPTSRSFDSALDDNHTETTALEGEEGCATLWDTSLHEGRPALPSIEPEDLTRPARQGPYRVAQTSDLRPRRLAIFHSMDAVGCVTGVDCGAAPSSPLLSRQDSGSPTTTVLVVKYYDTHDRLGLFDGREGRHLGDQRLELESDCFFVDLCVSNRYQVVYLIDQTNNRLYGVNLTGKLLFTVEKRLSGPLAACLDDRNSLLFVCQRRKVRVFRVQASGKRKQRLHHQYLQSIKSTEFRNLTSAAALNGRLWLTDSQADRVFVYAANESMKLNLVLDINLQNPLGISLDGSGSAFVASGEPLHIVCVFDPEGCPVGSFGGWESKAPGMKLPVGVCAYQLSHLVDKRLVAVCCFGEHSIRMYSLRNSDTIVV